MALLSSGGYLYLDVTTSWLSAGRLSPNLPLLSKQRQAPWKSLFLTSEVNAQRKVGGGAEGAVLGGRRSLGAR